MTSATLIGVGVGPGDPELVTVKAVRVLREADLVLVPVADTGERGRAEATVLAHVSHDRIRRVTFALDAGAEQASREAPWDSAADTVAAAFGSGAGVVAFATIGDPNVYSTFTYLAATVRERVPSLDVATIPGITAMQDLAARSGTVLCEGNETLALLPLTAGIERFGQALATFDTVVGYKSGRHLPEVLAAVRDAGRRPEAEGVVRGRGPRCRRPADPARGLGHRDRRHRALGREPRPPGCPAACQAGCRTRGLGPAAARRGPHALPARSRSAPHRGPGPLRRPGAVGCRARAARNVRRTRPAARNHSRGERVLSRRRHRGSRAHRARGGSVGHPYPARRRQDPDAAR